MEGKPPCYGTMFPDLDRLEYNTPCRGKAFTVLVTSQGIGVQSRTVTVDEAGWEACQRCPAYRSCYDLCLARLSLQDALHAL
jgi:hypothetical protein